MMNIESSFILQKWACAIVTTARNQLASDVEMYIAGSYQ
jgi:hypothetical protein